MTQRFNWSKVARGLMGSAVLMGASMAQAGVVVDIRGIPVFGAEVSNGQDAVSTNAQGEFVAPAHWVAPQSLTVRAQGYVEAVFIDAHPQQDTLRLSSSDVGQRLQLQGELTEFGNLRTDGRVDVGILMPALREEQLLHFDVMDLISPESDNITVLGRNVALPSNIALPKQRESYIFPITLEKPSFRMFVRQSDQYRFLAVHGQFPLKRVVDDLRAGGSIFDVLNQVKILQTGVIDMDVKGDMSSLSIPVNQVPFNRSVEVQAPSLAQNEVLISVGLTAENGYLMPSDLKRLGSNERLALNFPQQSPAPQALSVMLKRSPQQIMQRQALPPLRWFDFLFISNDLIYNVFAGPQNRAVDADLGMVSLALHVEPGIAPEMLAHVEAPQHRGSQLMVNPPVAKPGLNPMGTYISWSRVEAIPQGQVTLEKKTRLWEIYVPNWVNQIDLPNHVGQERRNGNVSYRWESSFLARDPKVTTTQGVTHVTRNSSDE